MYKPVPRMGTLTEEPDGKNLTGKSEWVIRK